MLLVLAAACFCVCCGPSALNTLLVGWLGCNLVSSSIRSFFIGFYNKNLELYRELSFWLFLHANVLYSLFIVGLFVH